MRAITLTSFGGPEVLSFDTVADPEPAAGEVLVRVVAAGVNRADVMQRRGHYPPPPGASEIVGLEVSGTIESVGADVTGWSPGDACVALLAGGGYAELVAVPAGQVLPPPPGIDPVDAAGVVEVAATVVSNLDLAALRSGQTLLVHGGAGGIGSFTIAYAKQLGAHVIATAGSAGKLDHCRRLGADLAVSYRDDWAAAVREDTRGRGADVILDVMGGSHLEPNVGALAVEGRLVVIGLQGGRKGTLDLGALLAKRASVHATGLRARPVEQKSAICRAVVERVWPRYADGTIAPPVTTRFALADAAQAHRWLDSGDHVGKAVLVV